MFTFPNPVNEKAARFVAGVVALAGLLILTTGWFWLLIPVAYGFWARVLAGPTFSPLARLAMKVMGRSPKYVPGPPKRFAQGMGAVMTTTAGILALAGATTPATVFVALLVVAATLESVFALCLGCRVFAGLMKIGVVPESVCLECANVTLGRDRHAPAAHPPAPQTR